MTEQELIQKILKGNTHAFENVVNANKTMVYSIALRLSKSREEAEELAQDVFMRVYENLHTFQGQSALKTWIYKIAFNWCMNKTKTKRHHESVSYETQFQLSDFTLNAYEQLAQAEMQEALKEALHKLDQVDSIIVTLFYLEEMSIDEISEVLSFSKSNIKVKLFRARKKLKEIIDSQHL